MKIAVIGAGNGGQAIAGHMASLGHDVSLCDRDPKKIGELRQKAGIRLHGRLEGLVGKIRLATTDVAEAIDGAEVIMIATTATAHKDLAKSMAHCLTEGQFVILNPGRTCGALEFRNGLVAEGYDKRIYVAEAQTLVYACRLIEEGSVNIIGVKDKVLISALPSSDTSAIIQKLKQLYTCFYPAGNILQTSFENIGAIFHPAVVLFNEAAIERGERFYFYRDMTPALSRIIEQIDAERLAVASAYNIELISAKDWVSYAYDGVTGDTLCERMHNNPAYYEILAPSTIHCRQITEDIPTGIVPIAELGRVAGVPTPVMDAVITMCSSLLGVDFRSKGRTLDSLGLKGLDVAGIIEKIK